MVKLTYDYLKANHEEIRKKVWAEAWASTASAITCKTYGTATAWADAALADFDKRFPAPVPPPESWSHPLVD